ncbi:MAG: hypothetical protein EHM56_09945 [Chloroflexi bacterium]|nr:MAG: hypothetical protein EHM56_09945 [Chloroflexota bacterium]
MKKRAAHQPPQFSLLSESQIQDLHLGALELLRRTGIRFYHPGALEMLKAAGAFVSDGNLARFPASLVEDAIASTPSRIVMCDRDGEPQSSWRAPGSISGPAPIV